ncbi:STAS domain-containing protein [Planctomycetales bacterium ZRK34]|nr:STAS domain-containing protein [Planctomycetales bacterium ZRK34]
MEIQSIAREDEVQQLLLSGSFDVAETSRVMMQLHYAIAGPGQSTILDMGAVDFMTSIGIGLLVACYTSLRNRGKQMVMYHVSDKIRDVFSKANITQLIPIVDDEAAALAAVN